MLPLELEENKIVHFNMTSKYTGKKKPDQVFNSIVHTHLLQRKGGLSNGPLCSFNGTGK
jgi:hypothetical protein